MEFQHRVMPFYMAYPTPYFMRMEDSRTRDIEYLQQLYPTRAKRYQLRIAEILDKLDYEGSMIYDEYPDRWLIYQLAHDIYMIIRREEAQNPNQKENALDWEWLADTIQIILYYEIYKRRHGEKRHFLKI